MFSIIICTYNGTRTIEKTIDHILAQEDYDNYIEQLIVVNNASDDETAALVKKYEQQNKLIYRYEEKPGLGNARRNGVNIACADWTIFVDDDNELDKNWIKTAANYIKEHPNISIFGGSVIPKLEFEPNVNERKCLCQHYSMLACTDLCRKDIDYSKKVSPFGIIIGAGMTVKTQYLKELIENGWIRQMGRTKSDTAAGDDGEISRFVTEKKKQKAGYCPQMIMEHNLPKERLQANYLLKLGKSLSIGNYHGQSLKRWYVLRRIKQVMKYAFSKSPYPLNSLEDKLWKQTRTVYFEMLRKDRLFFKNLNKPQQKNVM